jgi:hypothetical protein
MFLPNGVHIYLADPSIEAIERFYGMIERREPITMTSVENGVEIMRTIWHPDDPVRPLEDLIPKGYVPPPGRIAMWWATLTRALKREI